MPDLITIASHQKVGEAIDLMQQYGISQLPVVRDGELDSLADVIGSLQDRDLLDRVFKNPDALHENVSSAMQPPLAAMDADEKLDEVFSTLSGGRANAVVVAQGRQADRRAHAHGSPRVPGAQALDGGHARRSAAASPCARSSSTARRRTCSRRSVGSGSSRWTRSRRWRLPSTSSSGAGSATTTAPSSTGCSGRRRRSSSGTRSSGRSRTCRSSGRGCASPGVSSSGSAGRRSS